jgi:hypothetical protein
MPRSVIELIACWWTFGRWCRSAFFWCLWKERNNKCFEDLERSLEDILALFFHTMYLWIVAFVSPLSFSFVNFLVRFYFSS